MAALQLTEVANSAAQQTLLVERGWNLITLQAEPSDANPGSIFGKVPGLISVWAFDNPSKRWLSYHNPLFDPDAAEKNDLPGASIQVLGFGRPYWVRMTIPGEIRIDGTKPEITPPVVLSQGWNLIGIPIAGPPANSSLLERVPVISALAIKDLDYDMLLKWQEGPSLPPGADASRIAYNLSRFGTSAEGSINEEQFRFLDPNRGYWVRVTSPETLQPRLLTNVRGDLDVAPIGNFPNGPEDIVISTSPTPVPGSTQTKIVFFESEDIQRVSFSNEGGGVLLWEGNWQRDNLNLPEWLSLSTDRTAPGTDTTLFGATTTEQESLYLRIDRSNLSQGVYTGTFTLLTSGGHRAFQISAHIGGLKGEWTGFAEIQSVNGKRNKVPDIDLNLSFFEDSTAPGLLRGAIDSSQAVFWPSDVQLVGYITRNDGNAFQLGGSLVLPPGDQNNEPYDVFDASPDGNDVDWNDDGFNPQDRLNPFPFPVYRAVQLEGRLVKASPIDAEGYEIQGTYREIVCGMLKDAILLEGTFILKREHPTPFHTARSGLNATGTRGVSSPIATGPSPGLRVLSAGASTPSIPPIDIQADMILEDIQISFSITSSVREALTSSDILIELEAPSGERMVLHDGSRIEPTILANASYPNETTPLGTKPTWAAFKRSILTTRGNWTLHVQNKAPVAIKVQNVSILLVGQPVIDIYGRVLNTDGSGVASADISLSGTPFSLVFPSYSDENGDFVIPRIPAMPINLSASHPAFDGGASIQIEQLAPRFVGTTSNASEMALSEQFGDRPLPAAPPGSLGVPGYGDLGESSNQPFKINLEGKGGDPSIFAFPPSSAPGQVLEFHSVGNIGKGPFSWDFGGDGEIASGASATHAFARPGVYNVSLRYALGTITRQIIVRQTPGNVSANARDVDPTVAPTALDYQIFVFQAYYSGGGSLPANWESTVASFPPDAPAAVADLVMIQHAYAASADIDLAPKTKPNAGFADDSFTAGPLAFGTAPQNNQPPPGPGLIQIPEENAASPSPVNDPGWIQEDHNYVLWPGKWFDDRISAGEGRFDSGEDDYGAITGYLSNDAVFDRPRPTGLIDDQLQYFRMACHIGAIFVASGASESSVRPASSPGSDGPDPLTAPELSPGRPDGGVAANLHFELNINPFAGIQPE